MTDNWYLLIFFAAVVVFGLIFYIVFMTKQNTAANKKSYPNPFEDPEDATENEIKSLVDEGQEQGTILASEAEMIKNIFELGDKDAKDIMIHRTSICAVDGKSTLAEAFDFMLKEMHSRYLVYLEDIDNVIGLIHIKDAMIFYRNEPNHEIPVKDIKGLIRNVSFIPETRDITMLFNKMRSRKEHLVVVVDEYGQTAGIVCMEDILEEIVGNIEDEYDNDPILIVKNEDGSYLMDGMTPLESVLEELDIQMDEEPEHDTLNGLLISNLDHIPEENEDISIEFNGYVFKVLAIENKMIKQVKVTGKDL